MDQIKQEFLDNLINESHKAIWVAEILLLRDREQLAKAKAYLDLIPKRMEEKFYPTAGDGRQDMKNTQAEITRLESEIANAQGKIEKETQSIDLIERYRSTKQET